MRSSKLRKSSKKIFLTYQKIKIKKIIINIKIRKNVHKVEFSIVGIIINLCLTLKTLNLSAESGPCGQITKHSISVNTFSQFLHTGSYVNIIFRFLNR
jgi:hypothetical protein